MRFGKSFLLCIDSLVTTFELKFTDRARSSIAKFTVLNDKKANEKGSSSVDGDLAPEHIPYQWIALLFGAQGEGRALLVALQRRCPVDAALHGMLEVEMCSVKLLRPVVLPLGGVCLLEPVLARFVCAVRDWREGLPERLLSSRVVAEWGCGKRWRVSLYP